MNESKTYPRGGIRPPDNKSSIQSLPIKNAHIPSIAVIPMHQHAGAPAECIVKVGDTVQEGMLIGRATNTLSANVHSSIPGIVTNITEIYLPAGIKSKAVKVELEGEFTRSGKEIKKRAWDALGASDILAKIKDSGIVGLGGGGFPSHVKFSVPEKTRPDYFIVNGIECEPYLSGDYRLLVEKAEEIVEGIRILQRLFSPGKTIIGIGADKPDAIAAIKRIIAVLKTDIDVIQLKSKYPQGDEKMLIRAITGREVPSGGLLIDSGAIVSNVGTVFAVYEAIVFDKPLTERIVTISGRLIRNPANLKVRVGTKIGELIEDCGGFIQPPERLVAGGPLTGYALYDLDTPVTKTVKGILALSKKEIKEAVETPCIQCGRCIRSCPIGLSPVVLFKYIEHLHYDEARGKGLFDCTECGCCGYVCPAHIPLVQSMTLGKLMLKKKAG